MDPSNKESSALLSPMSAPEQMPASGGSAELGTASAEQALGVAERSPVLMTPAAGAATIPLPPLPTTTPPSTASAVMPSAALPADDGDLIEKEWVARAKQIVERTRDDPYKQSEDLTLFKADYMKKRYGKTIKVNR